MRARLATAWLSVALVAYFVVTAPVEAADLTRAVLGCRGSPQRHGLSETTSPRPGAPIWECRGSGSPRQEVAGVMGRRSQTVMWWQIAAAVTAVWKTSW